MQIDACIRQLDWPLGQGLFEIDAFGQEVFAVEDAARQVAADYPETAYLMGSSFLP